MKLKQAIKEALVKWNDQTVQTGVSPTGITGDYAGKVLPAYKKKSVKKKKKKKIAEATTCTDVTGTDTPQLIDWYTKKKKKKKTDLVRRKLNAGKKI